jgi:hypothetical protein
MSLAAKNKLSTISHLKAKLAAKARALKAVKAAKAAKAAKAHSSNKSKLTQTSGTTAHIDQSPLEKLKKAAAALTA